MPELSLRYLHMSRCCSICADKAVCQPSNKQTEKSIRIRICEIQPCDEEERLIGLSPSCPSETIGGVAHTVIRTHRGWVITDKSKAGRHQPAAGGVIRNPSRPALQKLPCRFKAYKGGSLDRSFLPTITPTDLRSPRRPPPPFSRTFSLRAAHWKQVAPRCGGPGYRNLGGEISCLPSCSRLFIKMEEVEGVLCVCVCVGRVLVV